MATVHKKITETRVIKAINRDDGTGYCLSCGTQFDGHAEPDARQYHCDHCDADQVYGAQEILIGGYFAGEKIPE